MLPGRNKVTESSITMLHTTMTAELKAVQTALTEGITRLENSTTSSQRSAGEAVNNELSRFRSELRDIKNRLLASHENLHTTLDTGLANQREEALSVQRGLQELHAALARNAPAAEPSTGTAAEPSTGTHEFGTAPEAAAQPAYEAPAQPAPLLAKPTDAPHPEPARTRAAEPETEARPEPDSAHISPASEAEWTSLASLASLTEQITAAVRDSLEGELRPVRETLESMRREIGTLHTAVATPHSSTPPTNTDIGTRPDDRSELLEASGADQDGNEALVEPTRLPATHGQLLATTSRISSVLLVCHQEMWEYLAALAGPHPHWRKPGEVEALPEDRVRAPLSGRSLIALLSVLHESESNSRKQDADWALAHTVYQRIAESVRRLDTVGERVTIALDDRAVHPTTDGQDDGQASAEDQGEKGAASPHEPSHQDDAREPAREDVAA